MCINNDDNHNEKNMHTHTARENLHSTCIVNIRYKCMYMVLCLFSSLLFLKKKTAFFNLSSIRSHSLWVFFPPSKPNNMRTCVQWVLCIQHKSMNPLTVNIRIRFAYKNISLDIKKKHSTHRAISISRSFSLSVSLYFSSFSVCFCVCICVSCSLLL